MARQDVENDPGGMDAVRQGFGAGRLYSFQPVGEDRAEDLDHLSVAAWLALQLALYTLQRRRQFPFLERRAVAQGTWLARENRDVVQRVVDCLVAPEGPIMPSHNPSILPAFDAIGVGPDLDRAADRARIDRIPVPVKPDEAGLGHRRRYGVESIERADIGHQARLLILEYLPDRSVRDVRVLVRLGVGRCTCP